MSDGASCMYGFFRFGLWLLAAVALGACRTPEPPPETPVSRAPFLLTLDEVARWTPDSALAEPRNVSSVPLAERFVDARSQLDPRLPAKARVLVAPDGIDGLANHLDEQATFNLYTFTHWSSIDVLNWFGGTADLNVSIPARPWVEAAHRNGVKVLGTVFFAPKAWGGDIAKPAEFLRRDEHGAFPYARKLVEIAEYYRFDGWLVNQETDLGGADSPLALGEAFLAFMAYLVEQRPEGMEIHWYDSMLPNGRVKWQNELNDKNGRFLQDGPLRTADAMFLNYWWPDDMLETSLATATSLGRSPFDVYLGADLWPGRVAQSIRRVPDWLDALGDDNGGPAMSIALFANNYNFTYRGGDGQPAVSTFADDAEDVYAFYRSGDRLFGGEDGNPAIRDPAGSWPGTGSRIPARSVLTALPFTTSFSTGHGKMKAREGVATPGEWHDISAQDILPSWQFAVIGAPDTQVTFDFDRAYEKGNALRIDAAPRSGAASVPLFKTSMEADAAEVELVYALSPDYHGAYLWLETDAGGLQEIPLEPTDGAWVRKVDVAETAAGGKIIRIGIGLERGELPAATLHLGELSIRRSDAA